MLKDDLTAEYVRSLLHYVPETGLLYWKVNRRGGKRAGDLAGARDKLGYRLVGIDNKLYRAIRLIWLIQTGNWPDHTIDHKDGDPKNDRWDNLREATRVQNSQNLKVRIDNTTGVPGVSWNKSKQKYCCYINVNNTHHHLGHFNELEAAISKRRAAEIEYFGEFRRNHDV